RLRKGHSLLHRAGTRSPHNGPARLAGRAGDGRRDGLSRGDPHLADRDTGWLLSIDGLDPRTEAGAEAVLLVGNGFAGVRGGLEEGLAASIPRTFIAGLFDHVYAGPVPPPSPDAAPQLVTAPDWLGIALQIEDERIHIEEGAFVEQTRV